MSIEWHWTLHVISLFTILWLLIILKLTEAVRDDFKQESSHYFRKYMAYTSIVDGTYMEHAQRELNRLNGANDE